MAGSGLFSDQRPVKPHLVEGKTGVAGEVDNLRQDVATVLGGLVALTVEEFTDPALADVDAIRVAAATVAAARTLSGADLDGVVGGDEMVPPRNVTVTTAGVTPADAPATATVNGYVRNSKGQLVAQSEVVTVSQIAGAAGTSQAFSKVGKEGAISVEEGKGIETEIKIVEGMQFDRGFLSPHFVTDPGSMTAELENPFILIHEKKLSNLKDLLPLMEAVSKSGRPLLVIAEDVESEALATFVVNKLRGILPCCCVKAPGFGDRRKAMLEDLAILTGGTAIFEALGTDLTKLPLDKLGRAKKVKIDADNTTLIEGAGDSADLSARIKQIRREIESTTSDYDREKLQERLAKLAGGVAKINVGAATELDMKQKKARIEDALHAARAAAEEGIVPGGGVALLRAAAAVAKRREKLKGDEKQGAAIVERALGSPTRQIATNSGLDGGVVADKVLAAKGAVGFDANTGEIVDLVAAGIIDPAKVARTALENAASVAGLLLTTETLVTDLGKDEDAKKVVGAVR